MHTTCFNFTTQLCLFDSDQVLFCKLNNLDVNAVNMYLPMNYCHLPIWVSGATLPTAMK
jgi:hypothetical protein